MSKGRESGIDRHTLVLEGLPLVISMIDRSFLFLLRKIPITFSNIISVSSGVHGSPGGFGWLLKLGSNKWQTERKQS